MTINLLTGEQRPPCPEEYSTRCAPVQPGGKCPRWRKFLARVTGGDEELQAYLARVAGYCLTGHISEHALFFLHGTGANGKTVFVNTLFGIMGDYAITAPMEAFVESRGERHPTEIAMLRGARLVIAAETEEGRHWNESRIKQLTGGDPIAARFMRGNFFEFRPTFKLIISGNHKPRLRNVDEAIRRRLHMIPFDVTIPKAEQDKDLQKSLEEEWPGILYWAVDGCLQWREVGLQPPPAVRDATDEYLASEDGFALWLDECTEMVPDCPVELTVDLFASWSAWADRTGEHKGTMRRFSQTMQGRGINKKRQAGTGKRGFEGVRIKRLDYSEDPRYG